MQSNTEFVFSLLTIASRLERRLDRALAYRKGVSFSEFNILNQLDVAYSGSATRVDLAAAVNLTPSAITRALKPLEKIGLVVTEKSKRDARRSLAILTPAGKELLSDANEIVQDEINSLALPIDKQKDVIDALSAMKSLVI